MSRAEAWLSAQHRLVHNFSHSHADNLHIGIAQRRMHQKHQAGIPQLARHIQSRVFQTKLNADSTAKWTLMR